MKWAQVGHVSAGVVLFNYTFGQHPAELGFKLITFQLVM